MPDGTIPFILFVGETSNAVPLQVTVVKADITADGFKETVTVNGNPAPQETDVGIT